MQHIELAYMMLEIKLIVYYHTYAFGTVSYTVKSDLMMAKLKVLLD